MSQKAFDVNHYQESQLMESFFESYKICDRIEEERMKRIEAKVFDSDDSDDDEVRLNRIRVRNVFSELKRLKEENALKQKELEKKKKESKKRCRPRKNSDSTYSSSITTATGNSSLRTSLMSNNNSFCSTMTNKNTNTNSNINTNANTDSNITQKRPKYDKSISELTIDSSILALAAKDITTGRNADSDAPKAITAPTAITTSIATSIATSIGTAANESKNILKNNNKCDKVDNDTSATCTTTTIHKNTNTVPNTNTIANNDKQKIDDKMNDNVNVNNDFNVNNDDNSDGNHSIIEVDSSDDEGVIMMEEKKKRLSTSSSKEGSLAGKKNVDVQSPVPAPVPAPVPEQVNVQGQIQQRQHESEKSHEYETPKKRKEPTTPASINTHSSNMSMSISSNSDNDMNDEVNDKNNDNSDIIQLESAQKYSMSNGLVIDKKTLHSIEDKLNETPYKEPQPKITKLTKAKSNKYSNNDKDNEEEEEGQIPEIEILSSDDEHEQGEDKELFEYDVEITPHGEKDLGLLFGFDKTMVRGVAYAFSFAKDPITGDLLPAEKAGKIILGDMLVSVNGESFEEIKMDYVYQKLGTIVSKNRGKSVIMKFRRVDKFRRMIQTYEYSNNSRSESNKQNRSMVDKETKGPQSEKCNVDQNQESTLAAEETKMEECSPTIKDEMDLMASIQNDIHSVQVAPVEAITSNDTNNKPSQDDKSPTHEPTKKVAGVVDSRKLSSHESTNSIAEKEKVSSVEKLNKTICPKNTKNTNQLEKPIEKDSTTKMQSTIKCNLNIGSHKTVEQVIPIKCLHEKGDKVRVYRNKAKVYKLKDYQYGTVESYQSHTDKACKKYGPIRYYSIKFDDGTVDHKVNESHVFKIADFNIANEDGVKYGVTRGFDKESKSKYAKKRGWFLTSFTGDKIFTSISEAIEGARSVALKNTGTT